MTASGTAEASDECRVLAIIVAYNSPQALERCLRSLDAETRRVDGVLVVELTLAPGLATDQVQALATRVGERLATDGELRARIDGLTFRLR